MGPSTDVGTERPGGPPSNATDPSLSRITRKLRNERADVNSFSIRGA
jgi:hypothetical protein